MWVSGHLRVEEPSPQIFEKLKKKIVNILKILKIRKSLVILAPIPINIKYNPQYMLTRYNNYIYISASL